MYHGNLHETVFINWVAIDHVANLTEIHLRAMLLGAKQAYVHVADLLVQSSRLASLLVGHQVAYTFAPNLLLVAPKISSQTPGGSKLCDGADLSALRALISGR